MRHLPAIIALLFLMQTQPVRAQVPSAPVEAILAEAGPGTRWGLVVLDEAGNEVVAINPEGRFIPASNTKIDTTAAAAWAASRGHEAEVRGTGARVEFEGDAAILVGNGSSGLSGAADCIEYCLSVLADSIAQRTRAVGNVVGDDTAFPDQRWSPGMSWNNIPTRSGTGISALSIDENEIAAVVTPGAAGQPPAVDLPPYYSVENRVLTITGAEGELDFDRMPGSRVLVLTGTIGAEQEPIRLRLGVDDPAHYAAWQLVQMLRARGVVVRGEAIARHRVLLPLGQLETPTASTQALDALSSPPLFPDLKRINKDSQNLLAELLLRRLGMIDGSGSIADGQAVIAAMLAEAGVPPGTVALSDGSGMSTYNRVTPRSTTALLGWIARQEWGDEWRETLPVAGVDGTLKRRFVSSSLEGRLQAKTGSLNATNALAGYFTAASGRCFTFAVYANDVPADAAATPIMDRALIAIAEAF